MYMIGHDRTGVGFIPVPLLNADLNGFGHETCDASILQPKGTARISLQSPIRGGERLTGSAQRASLPTRFATGRDPHNLRAMKIRTSSGCQ
jgi:hypothetical protein